MRKCLYLLPPILLQENRHRPMFTLSFPCAAVGAQQPVTWWLCWDRCCCPMSFRPGLVGVGLKCAHLASRHTRQLQGQSAWQMDARRAWKVESSGPGRTTIHRLVCLQKLCAKPNGYMLLWSVESKKTASVSASELMDKLAQLCWQFLSWLLGAPCFLKCPSPAQTFQLSTQ